jgi:hypothetical protein
MKPLRIVLALVTLAILSIPSIAAAPAVQVTGEHRGYTNEELFLRLDDEKEMTFLVRIPGDAGAKWHHQFEILSRITVTYHQEAGEKLPIATAIRTAAK